MSTLMTVKETARFLRIHPETLREKARRGEIPAMKVGRTWRFQRERLEQWMADGGDIPEHLVEAGMVAYVREQTKDPEVTWETFEKLDPRRKQGKDN